MRELRTLTDAELDMVSAGVRDVTIDVGNGGFAGNGGRANAEAEANGRRGEHEATATATGGNGGNANGGSNNTVRIRRSFNVYD